MRDTFHKLFPIASGLLLGWFLFHPPAWMEALGPLSWLVNGALCGVVLLGVVAFVILSNLPDRPQLEPLGENEVPRELREVAARLHGLGFTPAGPPRRVHIAPPAVLLAFVHPSQPVYATAFRTGTVPAKVSWDFVSVFDGARGGLTTNAEPGGAALPAAPGGFRQVFPGESLDMLFRRHLEGLAFLRERGLSARAISAGTFEQDFVEALARQREQVLSAPLRSTWITLWRSATKRVPFVGPLREQRVAREQLEQLRAA